MEKTFWQDKIVFKTEINMRDRQKISKHVREREQSKDEMQLTFDIFPVRVVSINWKTDMTDAEKVKRLEELTDFQLFKEVGEVIGELQMKASWIDEKKKTELVSNSTNWTTPEK